MATREDTLGALRRALEEGEFPAGSRMPSERDLARKVGAGRGTLRKALDALEGEGLIRRHVGRGTYVVDPEDGSRAAVRFDAPPSPADVMEARLMVEPEAAAAAALRARPGDIALLERAAGDDPSGDWRDWEARDNAFHTAVARASGNPILAGLLDTLHDLRARADWGRLRQRSLTPERRADGASAHQRIVAAIARRDPQTARREMRDHLASVRDALFSGPDGEESGSGRDAASGEATESIMGTIPS